jgi:drug/metabolite transporter (DMT)-like permease
VGLAVACLGLAPLAKKAALSSGAGALPLAVVSTAVAAGFATLIVGTAGAGRLMTGLPRRAWLHVFAVGAMGSGAVVLLSVLAMTETTATNRSLFQSMYPVATAIAARFLLGERLSPAAYGIIAVMSSGLFLMNTGSGGIVIAWPFWLLAATLPLIGLADVYAKRTLGDADPRFVAAGRLFFGTLVLLAVLPLTAPGQWLALADVWFWIAAAGLAMAGGVLGLYRAMDTAGASVAAAFIALAPVITATAEWLVLGTSFSLTQLTGLALVVGGAAALAFRV